MSIQQAVRTVLGSMLARGKVVSGQIVGGRTILQVTMLDGDVRDGVELLLPHGVSAVPTAGSDVLMLTQLGQRDHQVAIGADSIPTRIAGLQPGEMGLSDGTRIIAVRNGRMELLSAGEVLRQLLTDHALATYNAHTHTDPQGGTVGPPSPQMTSADLTGALHAGGQA